MSDAQARKMIELLEKILNELVTVGNMIDHIHSSVSDIADK